MAIGFKSKLILASAVAAVIVVAVCFGVASAGSQGSATASKTQGQQAVQSLTLYVFRGAQHIMGPDGKSHDTIVPANFVVRAGVPVRLTVINYDESNHSITASGLNLDLVIKPGTKVGKTVAPVSTTFTFTATKKGVFRWYCRFPCDKGANLWAMGQGYSGPGKEGFMAGYIVVI